MTVTFVYDDGIGVPAEIGALLGIPRFGALLHERRRLREHVESAAASFGERIFLGDRTLRARFGESLAEARPDARYVYLTADIVGSQPGWLDRFLQKLAFAEHDVVAVPSSRHPGSVAASLGPRALGKLLALDAEARRSFFVNPADFESIPADGLVTLSDPEAFVRFVSGSFYTRAFNAIRRSGRTIRKESADVAKMKAEHDYWYLLPPPLKRFFVQPYDFAGDGRTASYQMERLAVPDLAVLWVHGHDGISEDAFEVLLDAAFGWVRERTVAKQPVEKVREVHDALYLGKVRARVEQLLATEPGRRLDALIAAGTPYAGLRPIIARYEAMLGRISPGSELAITHGDLCFSNILFEKRSGLARFIDPRGATTEADLWSHPAYDLAKLSHSALGGYDFVNHGLFEVTLDEGLQLRLHIERPPAGRREAAFRARLGDAGFDERQVRLYEASLFLSMLPLHAEAPRKLIAFVLIAIGILDEIDKPAPKGMLGWIGGA